MAKHGNRGLTSKCGSADVMAVHDLLMSEIPTVFPQLRFAFVEASAHVLAATPNADWLEYLDLAGPVLADPCRPVHGSVTAAGPGLGIEWREAAVARYAA